MPLIVSSLLLAEKLKGSRKGGRVSGAHVPGPSYTAPYFFLSYAHTPRYDPADPADPDAWVVDLYKDLCNDIMQLTSLPLGSKPGFMDRELRPGNAWPMELAQALSTCRVFVPLYSRRYFESAQCGREWFAFSRRVLNQVARGNERAGAIIPAIWVPLEPSQLPEAARSIQFDHRQLGDRYVTHGLYGIIKLSRYRDAYEEAVYELARRIVEVAQYATVEPEQPADYETLESSFGTTNSGVPGGRQLRLTVVAPHEDDLPAGRSAYHYGRTARDWNPYRPDSVRSLADHASDLARNLDCRPDVGDLQDHADALISDAPPSHPEILIVDAWATTQPECQEMLKRFDAMTKPWIQVVVPWNRSDTETVGAESRLRLSLDASLKNKLDEGRASSVMAVRGVPSLEDFSRVLPTVVRTAVRGYLRHAPAHPPAGPAVEKPRLLRPAAEPQNPERTNG
jgi:FxsC-like protein